TGPVTDEAHVMPVAPPAVDVDRQGDPQGSIGAQPREVGQQFAINGSRVRLGEVVGMRDEARQAILLADDVDLLLPKIDRIVPQDVKERVVLNGRQRKLENLSDE